MSFCNSVYFISSLFVQHLHITSVFPRHMGVDTSAAIFIVKGLHAYPADVRLAARTRHMIASAILHDICLATRTCFDVVLHTPLLISSVTAGCVVPVCSASKALMKLDVACRTDTDETTWTT